MTVNLTGFIPKRCSSIKRRLKPWSIPRVQSLIPAPGELQYSRVQCNKPNKVCFIADPGN